MPIVFDFVATSNRLAWDEVVVADGPFDPRRRTGLLT
jgi:hypothetical protein